jgi:hypothetical protein
MTPWSVGSVTAESNLCRSEFSVSCSPDRISKRVFRDPVNAKDLPARHDMRYSQAMDLPENRKDRVPLSPLDTMRESLRDLQLGRWDDVQGFLARIDRQIAEAEQDIEERAAKP